VIRLVLFAILYLCVCAELDEDELGCSATEDQLGEKLGRQLTSCSPVLTFSKLAQRAIMHRTERGLSGLS
jgi:hypothetical protein